MSPERPNKRRKTSLELDEETESIAKQIILDEIDLEIGIRQRLQETINSRITWALLLQQSLESGITSEAFLRDEAFDFKAAALEALHASEAPILPLLSHEARFAPVPPLPPFPRPHDASESSVASVEASSAPAAVLARTSLRTTRARGQPSLPRTAPKKLLYLRNTSQHPPTLAKLVCPDCARADLPNVQGLLNHCRLRHGREFGSHEECIRACAVLVSREDEAWVVEQGVELPEISLPSLRTLFERAVGADDLPTSTPAPLAPSASDDAAPVLVTETPQDMSTHLSRTLGHHIDTPALAPFLGRIVQRRAIAVHGEDNEVDITGMSENTVRRPWRMPFTHRSVARPALDLVDADVPDLPPSKIPTSVPKSGIRTPMEISGSRFHIAARIVVADRSLWLPLERRDLEKQDHTHRWMLSVDSPSYSFHVSTFLTKMTIRSVTDPPPSTLQQPMVVSAYPFAALSSTDRPFLAEITFSFVGQQNMDKVVHHWVELDAVKNSTPALGEEQVLDIELDRTTELLPAATPVPLTSLWAATSIRGKTLEQKASPAQDDPAEPYARLLKTLVSRFPMTARDAKGRPPPLPYKLVSGPQALRALVVGRRKAIEMGRARALLEAYEQARNALPPAEKGVHLTLSVADVFCWLEDEGLFLRSPRVQQALPDTRRAGHTKAVPLFCASCGIALSAHPRPEAKIEANDPASSQCMLVPHPPRVLLLDPARLSADQPPFSLSRSSSPPPLDRSILLTAVDPRLIDATARIVGALHLSSPDDDCFGLSAPAILALALRAFTRSVLCASADVLRADVRSHGHRRSAALLTPAHVLRALEARPALRLLAATLATPVAKAGVGAEAAPGTTIATAGATATSVPWHVGSRDCSVTNV